MQRIQNEYNFVETKKIAKEKYQSIQSTSSYVCLTPSREVKQS